MIKKFFFFLFLVVSNLTFAQELDGDIFSVESLELKPEFPGGSQKFAEFISKNFKVPNEKGLKGEVFVEFVVEKDGTLDDIKVLKDIGFGTGKEAVRVLKTSPLWTPGQIDGKFVRVKFSLPIVVNVK